MMDKRSETNLQHVHPDLVKVIEATSQSPQPFTVVYGIRTDAAERQAVATGHSQTMHSRHLPQSHENLQACAVDVAALDKDGHIDWASGREKAVYGQIWNQIKAAADTLKIPVEWGGADIGAWTPGVVSHYHDWGHFQLPYKEYP